MKILYAISECLPFFATGGLADVGGALPHTLCEMGQDCRVVMPLYQGIPEKYRKDFRFVTHFEVQLSWRNQYCGVFETVYNGTTYYFLDNEYYFKRDGIYGFGDDAERFAFFGKAILEMLTHLDFAPDILHVNDWQTAMALPYLNYYYRQARNCGQIRSVFTVHNIQHQGKFDLGILSDVLGFPDFAAGVLEYDGCINMMKAALEECDQITTVSPTYAKEILYPFYSYGLDRFLSQRQYKLTGIINGIDRELYDPQTDPMLFARYSAGSLWRKKKNKQALQRQMGLQEDSGMLVGMVTRLAEQKGLDLVRYSFVNMVEQGLQFVIVGSGAREYEEFFRYCEQRYPGRVAVHLGYSTDLAHKTYAGADAFLMPSKFEPCGLSQLIALRYGCIPVVRKTGGLSDTVRDAGEENGNGFVFENYNADEMKDALLRAQALYRDQPKEWEALVKTALGCDFGWGNSARQYLSVYEKITAQQ